MNLRRVRQLATGSLRNTIQRIRLIVTQPLLVGASECSSMTIANECSCKHCLMISSFLSLEHFLFCFFVCLRAFSISADPWTSWLEYPFPPLDSLWFPELSDKLFVVPSALHASLNSQTCPNISFCANLLPINSIQNYFNTFCLFVCIQTPLT